MNERPILFNAEMTKALLDGRKTMTRRPVKCDPSMICPNSDYKGNPWPIDENTDDWMICPFGKVGDLIGAIEASGYVLKFKHDMPEAWAEEWKGHVFKWFEITGVRVERVQEISNADIGAEGACKELAGVFDCKDVSADCHRECFEPLWNSSYNNWDANPWTWVVEFKAVK